VRLRADLAALMAAEATELRALVRDGGSAGAIEAALARHRTAEEVSALLEKNANVPLALEGAWLALARRA
jgi:hypothetical protein